MCREDGGIIDDLIVYQLAADRFSLVINASNSDKDLDWIRAHLVSGVELIDQTNDVSLIAFQGPKAQQLLPDVGVDLDGLFYFGLAEGSLDGVPVTIARTGYTGEDGFEIFLPSDQAARIWDRLLATGATPCGLGARDVLRLEAGLRLYGNDMDESIDGYAAGLGWTIRLSKGEFIGRSALVRIKAEGPSATMVGLTCADRAIPRHGCAVLVGDDFVGTVTSGTYSFWLNQAIATASLKLSGLPLGTALDVDVRGARVPVSVVELPFYKGSVRNAVAQ
jgi:aminomethyltransferase